MNQIFKRAIQVIILAGIIINVGCLSIGGSDKYESKNPTLGRQLQDLKTARDQGAIDDAEYQQAKSKLLSDGQRG